MSTALDCPVDQIVLNEGTPLYTEAVLATMKLRIVAVTEPFIMTTQQVLAHMENDRLQAARRLERGLQDGVVYYTTTTPDLRPRDTAGRFLPSVPVKKKGGKK